MTLKVNPLGNINNNYSKLKREFDKNKDKNWVSWLNYDSLFAKPGKQGVVGLLKTKKHERYCVFKISQEIDNLVNHENIIMEGLGEMMAYCPHFTKTYGIVDYDRNPNTVKNENPFVKKKDVKYMIPEKMLIQEYIDKRNKFYNYIMSISKINEDILYSTVKQVLMAITMAQQRKKFSHYDLHSLNIMMKRCNEDVVFVYVLDDDNQICVPTFGHYPIIIDYGFSYIENMDDGPLWPTLSHSGSGFLSDRFDPIVDPKLFLVTVADEIHERRNTKKSKILKNIVKKIFKPLSIDWDTGWDMTEDEHNATEKMLNVFEKYSSNSSLFSEYPSFCLDIINSLIILPIEKQETVNVNTTVKIFIDEWVKIENVISNSYYHLYILKGIVDSARTLRSTYLIQETTKQAVHQFKCEVIECVDKVAKFVNISNINYEKLLCSLYTISINTESMYYDCIKHQMKRKQKEYDKMPFKTCEHIYAAIDTNIKSEYEFNKKTTVFVMDSVKNDTFVFNLTEDEISNINKSHSFCKGTMLYDICKDKHISSI